MLRCLLVLVWAIAAVLAAPGSPVTAEASPTGIPETKGCEEIEIPSPDVNAALIKDWTACERWVWSCIVEGKEANLFAKVCASPRPDGDEKNHRKDFQFAPFFKPEDYKETNLVSDAFLRSLLSEPALADRIPASGIRIFGGYFGKLVNLENVTTAKNLVLDGSIFKRGLRMTNFASTKNVSLDGANLRGRLQVMRARIDGSFFMERGVFDFVDLRDARIGASLEASRSVFNDMLRFDRAQIAGKVYLVKSLITSLNAWDATVGGSMELRLADIRLRMDLTGSTVHGDVRLQEVASGRRVKDRTPSCEWNPDKDIDHILHEAYGTAKSADPVLAAKVLDEMMRSRPTAAGKPTNTLCDEPAESSIRIARHEFLLRDMKINGTLCVMDTTGEIATVEPGTFAALDTISLDGTNATSTVLRWRDSTSSTLWHAVNFKTGHMLINLRAQPQRHFIDNLDVKFISFVKADSPRKSGNLDEDDDKYLCDVTPREENVDRAEERDTQDRIVRFFTGESNISGSAQPFANIVSRLQSSGLNTKYLDIKLSAYKSRNACQTSQLMRNWNDLPWSKMEQRLASLSVDEARKFVLDGVCTAGVFGSRWLVSYGHEPHNLIFWVFIFIAFFWAAMKLDRRETADGEPDPKYSLVYAIDNFNPLRPYRIDPRSSERKPSRRVLRIYLAIHRALGVLFAVLFFIFVYRASV